MGRAWNFYDDSRHHQVHQGGDLFEDWKADADVRALFNRRWGTRSSRCRAGAPARNVESPITVIHLSDPQAPGIVLFDGLRDYFLRQGVGTLLVVPLISHSEINGFLSLRFAEKRDRLDPSNLVLEIDDNGCGINTSAETREGFGLVNIRARVKKLNGSLEIRSAPGRGTSILVTVPLRISS